MTTVTVSPRFEERPKDDSYVPRTQLGAGIKLLSIPAINEEIMRRRGCNS